MKKIYISYELDNLAISLSSCYLKIKPYTKAITFQQNVIISDLSPRQILVDLSDLIYNVFGTEISSWDFLINNELDLMPAYENDARRCCYLFLRGTNFNKMAKDDIDKLIIERRSNFHDNIFPIYEKYVRDLLKK